MQEAAALTVCHQEDEEYMFAYVKYPRGPVESTYDFDAPKDRRTISSLTSAKRHRALAVRRGYVEGTPEV
jgi:hypothetical protein